MVVLSKDDEKIMSSPQPIFNNFLKNREHWKEKWIGLKKSHIYNFSEKDFKDELTPFYDMPLYDSLSQERREKLFFEYIKLIAEAQILLEQILIFGFYHFRNKVKSHERNVQDSIQKLSLEELYHSQAYRDFLSNIPQFNWPEQKVFPKHRPVRKFMAWLIRKAPLGMTLPGAKIEAFSLAYNKMLRNIYGSSSVNSWTVLNQYHQQDEAYHVPLEFDLYNATIQTAGPIKTLLSTLIFVSFLQYKLICGSWVVIARCFEDKNKIKRVRLTFLLAKWAIRHMPAYKETRIIARKFFRAKNPVFKRFLKFIYW